MTLQYQMAGDIMSRPEAVIFDTDNTIYPYEPAHEKALRAAVEKASKLLGISVKRFQEAFDLARTEVKRRLGTTASSHSRLLYFQRAIEIVGMKTQLLATLDLEQTYWRTFLSAAQLFPGVVEFVQDLRSAGIKTAIVTDLTAQIQFRKIIYFGLDDYFDYVVTSEESGADKPDPAPFQIALQKLQVAPENCWMIGDCAHADISGARSLNIIALQKRHAGVVIARDGSIAHAVFDEFEDLRRLLRAKAWVRADFATEHA